MKKTVLLNIVLVMLLLATPALAREKEPTGDPIDLRESGHQEYPADEPFYIEHGFDEYILTRGPR